MCDAVKRDQSRIWFSRFAAACGVAAIRFAAVWAIYIISIPEVKFEIFPVSPSPAAALLAAAVCCGFHVARLHMGAGSKQHWNQQRRKQRFDSWTIGISRNHHIENINNKDTFKSKKIYQWLYEQIAKQIFIEIASSINSSQWPQCRTVLLLAKWSNLVI